MDVRRHVQDNLFLAEKLAHAVLALRHAAGVAGLGRPLASLSLFQEEHRRQADQMNLIIYFIFFLNLFLKIYNGSKSYLKL